MKYLILLLSMFSTFAVAQDDKVIKNRAINQDTKLCVNDGGVEKCPLIIDGSVGTIKSTNNSTTAYTDVAPSVLSVPMAFENNSPHVAGGVFSGFQLGLSGDSQNRVGYIGMITESGANRQSSLVFGSDDGASRTEKMRITGDGSVTLNNSTPMADGSIAIENSVSGAGVTTTMNDENGGQMRTSFRRFQTSGETTQSFLQIPAFRNAGEVLVASCEASSANNYLAVIYFACDSNSCVCTFEEKVNPGVAAVSCSASVNFQVTPGVGTNDWCARLTVMGRQAGNAAFSWLL